MLTILALTAVILSFAAAVQLSITIALNQGEDQGEGQVSAVGKLMSTITAVTCGLYGSVVLTLLVCLLITSFP